LACLIQRAGLERAGELANRVTSRYPRVRDQEGPVGDAKDEEQ